MSQRPMDSFRLTRVRSLRLAPLPDTMTVVDGRLSDRVAGPVDDLGDRLFVMPGMVDAHAHVTVTNRDGDSVWPAAVARTAEERRELARHNLSANLRRGVFAVRDTGEIGDDLGAFKSDHDLPLLETSGRTLGPIGRQPVGVGDEVPGSALAKAVESRPVACEWTKLIVDGVHRNHPDNGIGSDWNEVDIASATERIRASGARAVVHALGRAAAIAAISAHADSIEHGWGLRESDLDVMSERSIAWTPTATALLDSLEACKRNGVVPPWLEEAAAQLRETLKFAERSGVTLLCGSDIAIDHGDIHREVETFIELGVDPEYAIRAATVDAWKFLGASGGLDTSGPVSFVAFDDDPVQHPSLLGNPRLVVHRGRIIQRRTDD